MASSSTKRLRAAFGRRHAVTGICHHAATTKKKTRVRLSACAAVDIPQPAGIALINTPGTV